MTRLLVVCALLLLAACGRGGLEELAVGETGRVVEVRSGDTLMLDNGLEVRLTGLDAPNADQPYSGSSRVALEALALGHEVQLFYGGQRRDRNGRALAHVRTVEDKVWLQQQQLLAGAAQVRTYHNNTALTAQMLDDEARARRDGKGLWALPQYRVLLPVEAVEARGFKLIEGRVTGVTTDAYGQTLILDDVLRLPISGMNVRRIALSGLEPTSLKGKLVRIRVRIRRDGAVVLDHREQIEILRDIAPKT